MAKLFRKDFVAMAESISQSAAIMLTDTATPMKAAKQAGEMVGVHIFNLRQTNRRFSSVKYHDYVVRRLGELGVSPKQIRKVSGVINEMCDTQPQVTA